MNTNQMNSNDCGAEWSQKVGTTEKRCDRFPEKVFKIYLQEWLFVYRWADLDTGVLNTV